MTKRITKAASFRAVAGALTAFVVVMMYSVIGFVLMGIKVATGMDIATDPAWTAGMSTLASAALGYLIGHQVGAAGRAPAEPRDPPDVTVTTPAPLTPATSACDKADCPNRDSSLRDQPA